MKYHPELSSIIFVLLNLKKYCLVRYSWIIYFRAFWKVYNILILFRLVIYRGFYKYSNSSPKIRDHCYFLDVSSPLERTYKFSINHRFMVPIWHIFEEFLNWIIYLLKIRTPSLFESIFDYSYKIWINELNLGYLVYLHISLLTIFIILYL